MPGRIGMGLVGPEFVGAHPPSDPKPPAFATFEDGYRAVCVVDAILESHSGGSVWTKVAYSGS